MTESLFFDIDMILMEAEKVQAEILTDSYNLEKLEFQTVCLSPFFPKVEEESDPTQPKVKTENEDLFSGFESLDCMPKGTKFKLPIWMAFGLSSQGFVNLQLQNVFEQEFINMSIAHPQGLNLREKCFYYYEVGVILSQRLNKPYISGYLGRIFLARIKEIFTILFNESESSGSNIFLQKLSSMEEQFYEHCKNAFNSFRIWNAGKILEDLQYKSLLNRKKLKIDKNQ